MLLFYNDLIIIAKIQDVIPRMFSDAFLNYLCLFTVVYPCLFLFVGAKVNISLYYDATIRHSDNLQSLL